MATLLRRWSTSGAGVAAKDEGGDARQTLLLGRRGRRETVDSAQFARALTALNGIAHASAASDDERDRAAVNVIGTLQRRKTVIALVEEDEAPQQARPPTPLQRSHAAEIHAFKCALVVCLSCVVCLHREVSLHGGEQWAVISVLIVFASGTSVGDIVSKGVNRIAGTLVGVALALLVHLPVMCLHGPWARYAVMCAAVSAASMLSMWLICKFKSSDWAYALLVAAFTFAMFTVTWYKAGAHFESGAWRGCVILLSCGLAFVAAVALLPHWATDELDALIERSFSDAAATVGTTIRAWCDAGAPPASAPPSPAGCVAHSLLLEDEMHEAFERLVLSRERGAKLLLAARWEAVWRRVLAPWRQPDAWWEHSIGLLSALRHFVRAVEALDRLLRARAEPSASARKRLSPALLRLSAQLTTALTELARCVKHSTARSVDVRFDRRRLAEASRLSAELWAELERVEAAELDGAAPAPAGAAHRTTAHRTALSAFVLLATELVPHLEELARAVEQYATRPSLSLQGSRLPSQHGLPRSASAASRSQGSAAADADGSAAAAGPADGARNAPLPCASVSVTLPTLTD